jgi:hypothetical protein
MAEVDDPFAYSGPIFDVQAHAVKPSALEMTSRGIWRASYLGDSTKHTITDEILATAADDLIGPARLQALGREGIQVVTVNLGFPNAPPAALLEIVEHTNQWMSARTAIHAQLIGTAILPPAPLLATSPNAGPSH